MATPPGFVPTPPPVTLPPVVPPVPMQAAEDTPGVKARIDALTARLTAAEATAAQVATLERRAILAERRADSAAFPALMHPDVAAHVSTQYDAYVARVGEAAKPYSDWLKADAATNPLVSPYIVAPVVPVVAAPVAPGTPVVVTPPPANPSATVIPGGAAPALTAFSEAAVRNMSAADVKANLAPIVDQAMAENALYISPELKQRLGLLPKPATA